MEILFGNKGIYHYMDAKIGTIQMLEEQGRMYQVKMLVENEFPYILTSSMICTDGEVWLSHNTKECYGMQAYLQQKAMNGQQLRSVLKQIMRQARLLEEYLLDASDLVVHIEYLFFHRQKEAIRMLCVPGYQKPLREQLAVLLEYLMPRFDHRDREGELFLYECHRILADDWCDMTDFLALLNERTDVKCEDLDEQNEVGIPKQTDKKEYAEETTVAVQQTKREDVDSIFSKRFLLYALAGGAALALIIKYLFFDGTTGTAIFGIIWLLTLIILAIMTAHDKTGEEEPDTAMQEYKLQHGRDGDVEVVRMKLVPLTNGALEPFRIPQDRTSLTIGRDKSSDYRVSTTQISRVHVRLFCRPDGLYIEDQNSTNGTYINTKRIPAMTEQKLEKGDVVGLANEEFFVA